MDAGSFRGISAQRVVHNTDVINLFRPDLVVITGDITSMQPPNQREADNFGSMILENLEAPVYLTPGNHDVGGDPDAGYYVYQNPYPDYAFTFGPVRFISLDQSQLAIEVGSWVGDFTDEQLRFLDDQLSDAEGGVTVLLFHDHWAGLRLHSTGFTLALAGHNHANLAYDVSRGSRAFGIPQGPLLLVTGAPPRTEDMIRVVELGEEGIISCSYRPDDVSTAIPTKEVGIELWPASGGGQYQRLEVENNLDLALPNASWTFNLSNPGEGWEPLALGGSIEWTGGSDSNAIHRVRFDLPERSSRAVECFSLVPASQAAAAALGSMIQEGITHLASSRQIIQESIACLSEFMEDAGQGFTEAGKALEEGNWTEAAIQYSRADHLMAPIRELVEALQEAEEELQGQGDAGIDTSLVGLWLVEALQLLEEKGLHPSLMDTRKEAPSPLSLMTGIVGLDPDAWNLADEIAAVNHTIAGAIRRGEDAGAANGTLTQAITWFDLGYYSISTQNLETIYQRYPHLFVPEPTLVAFVLLVVAALIGLWNRSRLELPSRSSIASNFPSDEDVSVQPQWTM
jgi:predicted phosphodiesterase